MRRRLIFPILALVAVLAPVPVLGSDYAETTEHLYIHNAAVNDCADQSQQFLVYEEPTSGSNCGYIYGLPLNEVEHHTNQGLFGPREYFTTPSFGTILDATRELTGTIVVSSRTSVCASPAPVPCAETGQGTGLGEVIVDVVATAQTVSPRTTVTLGSASPSTTVTPGTTRYEVPFTIEIPDTVDRAAIRALSLSVHPRGVHVHSGYANASGLSFIEVPSLTPVEPVEEEG